MEQARDNEKDYTVVLITGAARGIGRELFTTFISRPQHIVIATVRSLGAPVPHLSDPSVVGEDSRSIVLKLDSANTEDASSAIHILETQHGIEKLDIVIANAGISKYFGKATETPVQELYDHFGVNSVAPLLLFQATWPLLQKSSNPKFVGISSGAGSLTMVEQLKVENTAYGASKAALNFITRRIHAENPGLIAFVINPGWLQTDLGTHAATTAGLGTAPVAVEDGVRGIVGVIDSATREKTSGRFMSYENKELPW